MSIVVKGVEERMGRTREMWDGKRRLRATRLVAWNGDTLVEYGSCRKPLSRGMQTPLPDVPSTPISVPPATPLPEIPKTPGPRVPSTPIA